MTEAHPSYAAALALLASSLGPVAPSSRDRRRLTESLSRQPYAPFVRDFATHFALGVDRVKEILANVEDPAVWTRGVTPIEGFFHFKPGAELAPLRGGLVRMGAGANFPAHRHTHRELTFVLAGELVDDSGRVYGPGDAIDMPEGSTHSIGVSPRCTGGALVALLHGRIEMLG